MYFVNVIYENKTNTSKCIWFCKTCEINLPGYFSKLTYIKKIIDSFCEFIYKSKEFNFFQ